MAIENWMIWLSIATIIGIGTVLIKKFYIAWFVLGAALAYMAAIMDFKTPLQWGFFIAFSGCLILALRLIQMEVEKGGKTPAKVFGDRVTVEDIILGKEEYRGNEPEYPEDRKKS